MCWRPLLKPPNLRDKGTSPDNLRAVTLLKEIAALFISTNFYKEHPFAQRGDTRRNGPLIVMLRLNRLVQRIRLFSFIPLAKGGDNHVLNMSAFVRVASQGEIKTHAILACHRSRWHGQEA